MTEALPATEVRRLSEACGLELALFRATHVAERVASALRSEGVANVLQLADRIESDALTREAFRRSVAISVTGMFRDPEQFDALRVALGNRPRRTGAIRAWSAGCATGEEVWSLAATLAVARRAEGATVLGSDLLAENVRLARKQGPPRPHLLGVRLPGSLSVRFECRDIVRQGPPGGGWDVILCRNVAIYLGHGRRGDVHERLAHALAASGLLMLGRSERLTEPSELGLRRVAPHLYERVVPA